MIQILPSSVGLAGLPGGLLAVLADMMRCQYGEAGARETPAVSQVYRYEWPGIV